jgi:hypothetical protein
MINVTKKFQDFLATKLPWAKLYLGLKGNLHDVKSWIWSEVERKDMLFTPKWYFLCKHASCVKVDNNIGTNVQKGDWY